MELIQKTIGSELTYFEQYFFEAIKSDAPLLEKVMNYIVKYKGKQMRPMFVLLSAGLGGIINERSYRAALLVEMLHTSSLIHDDLIDDSMERRGSFSINALWKNRITVWAGDYLFAKSLLLALDHQDHQILKIYSDAIQQMIESELLQIAKSHKLNLKEEVYYNIINAKTASFLAAACAAGASSTFEDDNQVQKLYHFGKKTGIAFQLKDDLLDYSSVDIGKPRGNDIKEKKLTLPLIYTLNTCNVSIKRRIMHVIKHQNTDKAEINYIVEEATKAGGIQYAEEKMFFFRDEALKLLHEFPESDIRRALEELVRYTTDRTY